MSYGSASPGSWGAGSPLPHPPPTRFVDPFGFEAGLAGDADALVAATGHLPSQGRAVAHGSASGRLQLPVFSLDDTFSAFRPQTQYSPSPGSGTAGSAAAAPPGSAQHNGNGAGHVVGSGALRDTDSGSDSTGRSVPSTTATSPARAPPPRGGVLADAAVGGPVALDMDGRPDLNRAPPNWLTPDLEHANHVHWPWRPSVDDAGTTGLDELLSALNLHQRRDGDAEGDSGDEDANDDGAAAERLPDVVCGSDELKALLVAPFVQRPLNLLVHRVGDSLLLEGAGRFDIPGTHSVVTSASDTRRKALTSKLLYYSILAEAEKPLPLTQSQPDEQQGGGAGKKSGKKNAAAKQPEKRTAGAGTPPDQHAHGTPQTHAGGERLLSKPATPVMRPAMPPAIASPATVAGLREPGALVTTPPVSPAVPPRAAGKLASPGPAPSRPPFFRRALRWKFDDLSILLGVRTPLVRGPGGAEMSLQVHDQREYVSQERALDFWLDNVLNSVGNAAVCFHVDGVVQGYRVVPTDELPSLGVPPFSPVAVKDHASAVLHWLRSECTRDGGSYVLVKGADTKDFRLYDLADLHRFRDESSASGAAGHEGALPMPAAIALAEMGPKGQLRAVQLGAPPMKQLGTTNAGTATSSSATGTGPTSTRQSSAFATPSPPPEDPQRYALVAHRRSVEAIDSDAEGDEPQHQHQNNGAGAVAVASAATAFDQPIAVMCFRMAQCLPPTDAEAHRLHTRALALFPEDDVTVATLRAACHAAAAQHLMSSSPLPDAEALAVEHARKAIRDVAVVVTADETTTFLPARHGEAPLKSALSLGMSVVRLMCGAALRRVEEQRWGDAVRALVTAQAFLSLFGDQIPTGLLTDSAAAVPDAAPPPMPIEHATGKRGPDLDGNRGTSSGGKAKPQVKPAPDARDAAEVFRQELLAGVASIESITGDVVRAMLEWLAPSEAQAATARLGLSSATSVERDEYEGKRCEIRRLQIELERETVEVMTLVARAQALHQQGPDAFVPVPTFEEALDALPDNLLVLRTFGAMEPTADALFDAALVAYQSALGHMPATQAGERSAADVRRKVAKLYATLAAARSATFAACVEARKALGSDGSAHRREELHASAERALDGCLRNFRESRAMFASVGDRGMAARMAQQYSRHALAKAERVCEASGAPYCDAEQRFLDDACDTLQAAVTEASAGIAQGAAPPDVPPEQWPQILALQVNLHIIAATRLCTRLGDDAVVAAQKPASINDKCVPFPAASENAEAPQFVTLADFERVVMMRYLLPAAKAAKMSRTIAVDTRVTDMLADMRRAFAGLPALTGVPGLRPFALCDTLQRLVADQPAAARVDAAWMTAVTYRAAQQLHALAGPTGPAYAVCSLCAADAYLFAINALGSDALERRVEAVEKAVGALHDLKPWLAAAIPTSPVSPSAAAETKREPSAADIALTGSMAPMLASRLASVLLAVLKMQQEQKGKAASDGGVKALYAKALRVATRRADASDDAAQIAAAHEVLEELPIVFRSFVQHRGGAAARVAQHYASGPAAAASGGAAGGRRKKK